MANTVEDHTNQASRPTISRALFVRNLIAASGGMVLLGSLTPAQAKEAHDTTKRSTKELGLITDIVYYQGVDGYIKCFMARPDHDKPLPGLMLIHENRGLNNHTEDMAKRTAMEGYHVIAPDALSPVGGTLEELDENRNALKNLDAHKNLENFKRGLRYLNGLELTTEKCGVMGFSWGAGIVNQLVVKSAFLNAAVAYYGTLTPIEEVEDINVPVFYHLAELDQNTNVGLDRFLIRLLNHQKEFDVAMHEGVDHYFNNPLYEKRYNKKVAQKAWKQSIEFLNKFLVE